MSLFLLLHIFFMLTVQLICAFDMKFLMVFKIITLLLQFILHFC